MTTPRLVMPEIASGQNNKNITHNDALQILDILVQADVIDKDLTAPPGGTPAAGSLYIVGAGATGAWDTHDDDLAYYRSGWIFYEPFEGLTVWVNDEDTHYTWDGSAWLASLGSSVDASDVNNDSSVSGATVADALDALLALATGATGGVASVRAATTANITIATALNNGDSLDGVTLATDDLVLVKDQSAAEENGVYVVGVSPARATGFDAYDEHPGALISVQEGSTNADTLWLCTSDVGGTLNTTSIDFTEFTGGGGPGGSGNWLLQWGPLQNEAPASNFATLDSRNAHPVLDFDAGTDESAIFTGVLPADYAGGGISIEIFWAATSATSGDCIWQAAIERIDLSSLDIDADSFASAQSATTTSPGTSGQVVKTTINISNGANMDSLAAGEPFRLKINRDADNGSDNMTGDAEILRVQMVEQ